MDIAYVALAFVAGIAAFASPCCLPLVPVYLSYMVGTTPADSPTARRVAFKQSLAFVLGFTIVFITLYASVGVLGAFLAEYKSILRQVGGVLLIVMGLHVAGLIRISALYRTVSVPAGRVLPKSETGDGTVKVMAPSYARSTMLGLVFAAGWTPCIGPLLGGIIVLATQSSTPVQGLMLMVVFALGLGVPFVLVAVGSTALSSKLLWFRRHETTVSLVTGGMLILVGFLMFTNLFSQLTGFLPSYNFGI